MRLCLVYLVSAGCGSESGFVSARSAESCPTVPAPDERVVGLGDTEQFELIELWRSPLGAGRVPFHLSAAPLTDRDADGAYGPADGLDLIAVALDDPGATLWLLDGPTGDRERLFEAPWFDLSTAIAEIDAEHPGPEIVATYGDQIVYAGAGGAYLEASVSSEGSGQSWLTNLGDPGLPALLMGDGAVDLATAQTISSWAPGASASMSADLDGDGEVEILLYDRRDAVVRAIHATGEVLSSCAVAQSQDEIASLAVAQLDPAEGLELLVGTRAGLSLCTAGGVLLSSVPTGVEGPIVVAELDGDPQPEILAGTGSVIRAYEHDLTPLRSGVVGGGVSFSAVDLDQDGIHEILAWHDSSLDILRATGTALASWPFEGLPDHLIGSRSDHPFAADVDRDGLAEIVLVEWGAPAITVLENPQGGWSVRGGSEPWLGRGHHPGARWPDLALRDLDPGLFEEAGANVFQARAADEVACSSALSMQIEDACVDRCSEDATVMVWLENRGAISLEQVPEIELLSGGVVLETARLDGPLLAESRRSALLVVPVERLSGPLRAQLRGQGSCEPVAATWVTPVCERW